MRIIALIMLMALSGCGTITVPAKVVTDDGTVLSGTASGSVTGAGGFQVSDGAQLNCGGTYNALDPSGILVVPVACTDGRSGTLRVKRTPDGMSGSGTVTLEDGTAGKVAFGRLVSDL